MTSLHPPLINLASQPFRRERATRIGLAVLCAALFCSLLVLTSLIIRARGQASHLRSAIAAQRVELQRVEAQQNRFSAVLGRPQNESVFATTVFLNEIIARRAVSWTKAFKDLQRVLPEDTKLLQVRLPQVGVADASGTDRVELTMDVGAERPDAIIGLLKRLAASSSFGPPRVMSQAPPTQNDPLYRYRLTVAYAQNF
jgi:hypothetical protein